MKLTLTKRRYWGLRTEGLIRPLGVRDWCVRVRLEAEVFERDVPRGRYRELTDGLMIFRCETHGWLDIRVEACEPFLFLEVDRWRRTGGLIPTYGWNRVVPSLYAPSDRAWRLFWKEIDRVGIWKWSAHNHNAGVLDGTSWHLNLRQGGHHLKSMGSNRYPRGFVKFWDALERLVARQIPSPIPTRWGARPKRNTPYPDYIYRQYEVVAKRAYHRLGDRVIEQIKRTDTDLLDGGSDLWDAYVHHVRWKMEARFWTRECVIEDACAAAVADASELEIDALWMATPEFLSWPRGAGEPAIPEKRTAVAAELFRQVHYRAERLVRDAARVRSAP